MLKLTLGDIMCAHPIKVRDNIPIGKVAHLLLRYRINGILVVKNEDEGVLAGIFTVTDLLRLIDEALSMKSHRIDELSRLSNVLVGEVASKEVITLSEDTKITKVIAIMQKRNIHTIPVHNGDKKIVGVVGKHDILNVAFMPGDE